MRSAEEVARSGRGLCEKYPNSGGCKLIETCFCVKIIAEIRLAQREAIEDAAETIRKGLNLADADTEFSDGIKYGLEAAEKWVFALSPPPLSPEQP